jgi:uncharacterized protein DUF6920
MSADATRFDAGLLAGLDEPVRRFFTHALVPGAPLGQPVRLHMTGRIKVGLWLPFDADQEIDGRSFTWRARAGWGAFKPLHVVDRYRDAKGEMRGRLAGRLTLFHASDGNTTRSAAGRAALECVAFAPATVLPQLGVRWRAEAEDRIVAEFDLPPERPEVHAVIDERGALRSISTLRWGNVGQKEFGYIPCGAEIVEEARFRELVLPSSVTVGWWFGTPRYDPFFEARILTAGPG